MSRTDSTRAPVRTALGLIISIALLLPALASAQDTASGKALYEARCNECHERGVHQRKSRGAQNFAELRAQVVRWNRELGGDWRDAEIDAVSRYLNDTYYHHACTSAACRAGHAALGTPRLLR